MNKPTAPIPQLVKYGARPRSVDGMRPRQSAARMPLARPALRPRTAPMPAVKPTPAIATATPPPAVKPKPAAYTPSAPKAQAARRNWRPGPGLQLILTVIGAMVIGILIQSVMIGQLLVIAYGIAAYIFRIPSRMTFLLAITALLAAAMLLVWKNNTAMAQGYASYTFLLLVAGVIALSREIRKEGGRIYSSRKTQY